MMFTPSSLSSIIASVLRSATPKTIKLKGDLYIGYNAALHSFRIARLTTFPSATETNAVIRAAKEVGLMLTTNPGTLTAKATGSDTTWFIAEWKIETFKL